MPDPKTFISINDAQGPLYVGIDVGGTNIKLGIVDNHGGTLVFRSIATEAKNGPEDAAIRIGRALQELIVEAGAVRSDLARAGLATPGPMDVPAGMLLNPGNLPEWHNSPIRGLVSTACDLPVTFANDANAAAYGEYWRGAGEKYRSMVMFTLGTGVGGGIIVEENLIAGNHSCGAELGYLIIDPSEDAPKASIGLPGVLEAYCGSYAIERRVHEALAAGDASSVRKRMDEGEEFTPLLLAQEAEAGDDLADHIVMETARYLGIGIATVVHTIDPENVVVGGGVTFGGAGHPLGERFLQAVRDEATRRMIQSLPGKIAIEFATLGGDAGYIGSAGLARREHLA
ncbi:MAG: ROK family protein [Lacipirellulaceae bacterium]